MIHLPSNNKGSDHIKLQKNCLKITSVNNNEIISSINIHNHLKCIRWNCRSLSVNKILYVNYLIESYKPDIFILCETWLSKPPTLLDKRFDIYRTVDSPHQGVWILARKGLVVKSYINNEPFIIAVQLESKQGTFVIDTYLKEKAVILDQLRNLIVRIRKYWKPQIIIFGDFNTNSNLKINQIETITGLKNSGKNCKLITREQQRKSNISKSKLDYFLSSTEITEIEAIELNVSDHKPIIANIANWEISNKIWRKYIYSSEYKASEENITKLLQTGWPNENSEQTKRLMQNKLTLRSVIKLQDRSTTMLKENTKWELQVTKLIDLRKEDFINTMKTLNMNSKVDRSRFHNTLNWIFKFKVKGKIVKGIKTEEGIIHGREKDKLIKIYFEKLFAANTIKIEIRNNAIFNYECDIKEQSLQYPGAKQ